MSTFNLADHYRAAGLTPGPDILRLRLDPFEHLRKDIAPAFAVTLARLYFGRPTGDRAEAFRAAFANADPSFSLVDNAREVAVLAGCLLTAALDDGEIYAGLAPVTAAAAGLRKPVAAATLLDGFSRKLTEQSISQRDRVHAEPSEIKSPAVSKIGTETTALAGAGDWGKAAALIKQTSDESFAATKALATQTASVVRPLAEDVADLREEVAMLWWYIGGWSRSLDCPLTDLAPGVANLLAGLDLADLSDSGVGPVAAPALLSRITANVRKGRAAVKLTLASVVDELAGDQLNQLAQPDNVESAYDICPVHCALAKARETGGGDGWHAAFKSITGLSATVEFKPLDLSLQAYREGLFLKSLS